MLQLGRWLTDDDYTTKLEDSRRLSLASLLTAAGCERSLILKRLCESGARRLATIISSFVARITKKVRKPPGVPRNLAKIICSTIDYRTDAALGHVAGKPSDAQMLPVDIGRANVASGKIAA